MAHDRRRSAPAIIAALAGALLLLVPVQAASATAATSGPAATGLPGTLDPAEQPVDDPADLDADPAAPAAEALPACLQPTEGYAPRGVCQLLIAQARAACVGGAPVLDYAVLPEGTPNTTVTITWQNPGGADVVYAGLPLTGRVLWPGTVIEDGVVVDWPGWTTLPDGSYVPGDEYDWVRPEVGLLFEVNPSATTVVAYPPETAPCANPGTVVTTQGGGPVLPVSTPVDLPTTVSAAGPVRPAVQRPALLRSAALAETGANSSGQLGLASALLAAGAVLVVFRAAGRRRDRA